MPYLKITDKLECQGSFQLSDGLNIFNEEFDPKSTSMWPAGLNFSDEANISRFFNEGINLRVVTLPSNDQFMEALESDPVLKALHKRFHMAPYLSGERFRSNGIILGKSYKLNSLEALEYLTSIGTKFEPKYCVFMIKNAINAKRMDLIYSMTDSCRNDAMVKKFSEELIELDNEEIKELFMSLTKTYSDALVPFGTNLIKLAIRKNLSQIMELIVKCGYQFHPNETLLASDLRFCISRELRFMLDNGFDFSEVKDTIYSLVNDASFGGNRFDSHCLELLKMLKGRVTLNQGKVDEALRRACSRVNKDLAKAIVDLIA